MLQCRLRSGKQPQAIEILAGRGLDGRISPEQWHGVCQRVEERMRSGDPEGAAQAPLRPGDARADRNELPGRPVVLD